MEEIHYCICGKIAKVQGKNGKWRCDKDWRHCPSNKIKYGQAGEKNGMYGKKQKSDSKKLMSIKGRGRIPWNIGVEPYNKGKTLEETNGVEEAKKIKEKRNISVTATMIKNGSGTKLRSKFLQGWYISTKTGKKLYYQSSYELAFFRILDRNDSILYFDRCRFSIPYFINGVKHHYTPDVIVKNIYYSFFIVYELKPKNENDLEVNQIKWETAFRIGYENDLFYFAVLNEEPIKDEIKKIYKERLKEKNQLLLEEYNNHAEFHNGVTNSSRS